MKSLALLALSCACPLVSLHAQSPQVPPADYRSMKYGFFVHYVWGGEAYSVTVNKNGSKPTGLDDLANRFDVEDFAKDLSSMGIEYVVFTAWHANMNLLFPSKAMDKWLPGHTSKRDLLGDMIKACKAKGIQIQFYTHPRDGHDFIADDQAKTGWAKPWIVDVPAGTTARFIRLERTQPGSQLRVNEFRVIGKFE